MAGALGVLKQYADDNKIPYTDQTRDDFIDSVIKNPSIAAALKKANIIPRVTKRRTPGAGIRSTTQTGTIIGDSDLTTRDALALRFRQQDFGAKNLLESVTSLMKQAHKAGIIDNKEFRAIVRKLGAVGRSPKKLKAWRAFVEKVNPFRMRMRR